VPLFFAQPIFAAGTDITELQSETNERYLLSAADVIGSILCLRGPRHVCLAKRRKDQDENGPESVEGNVKQDKKPPSPDETSGQENSGDSISEAAEVQAAKAHRSIGTILKKRLIMIGTKCRGANNEPPPPFTSAESVWTFVGCFLTLLMLLSFSDAITKRNSELSLVLGPFGALMTLQYSLTAAP